jgi:hypothetical protein
MPVGRCIGGRKRQRVVVALASAKHESRRQEDAEETDVSYERHFSDFS